MKIDHQENCEYRFSSIFINFIDFSCFISISEKIVINIIDSNYEDLNCEY